MALKLDNSLLQELGLGALPDSEKQLLLRQIYERLEMNVGMRLADQMSNEQLDAFEKFVDANDDKGAFQWLESNFPNYKDVVNEEFEKLKHEIRSVAPQILASAQNAAAVQQGAAAQGQPQPAAPPQPQQPYAQPPAPAAAAPQPMPGGQPAAGFEPQQPYAPAAPQAAPAYGGQPAPQPAPQSQQFQPAPNVVPPAPGAAPQGYAQAAAPTQPYGPPPQHFQPAPGMPAGGQPPHTPYGPPPQAGGAMPQNGHLQPQYGVPVADNMQPPAPGAGDTPPASV